MMVSFTLPLPPALKIIESAVSDAVNSAFTAAQVMSAPDSIWASVGFKTAAFYP